MIEPGIYTDLSNEDYHKDPAISRSGVILFNDSPYRYWANYLNPARPPKKETEAMIFGTAFHTFILEPASFDKNYVYFDGDRRTKKGKEEYEELMKTGKIIISFADRDLLEQMKASLERNMQAWQLIQRAEYEASYFWKDKTSGLMVKARPDILHSNMIIDLKTIKSASSREYQKAMVEGGYHIQGAMVQDAVHNLTGNFIDTVINICVEKTYPYAVGIKIISESTLDKGRNSYKEALIRMRDCLENDKWPDYEVETVELPLWAN